MSKLVFLGTATNIPDENHENTHMVLVGKERMILIDGPANPYSRLLQAKLDVNSLTDIVITHFHPDHAAGIPLLLMALGLSGREKDLNIFANAHCMSRMVNLLEAFDWDKWHFFPVNFHKIPEKELHPLLEDDEFRVFSSPVKHFIPAIGLRVELLQHNKVIAYSGDTAPTESLFDLSKNADVLIHEAGGASEGHTSARQAGELAAQVNAKSLYLVHYPVGGFDYQQLAVEAALSFGSEVVMAEDLDELDFDQI
jgi:ribonuclease Z